jgi:hypothetical protein
MKEVIKQNKTFLAVVGFLLFVALLYEYSILREKYIDKDSAYVIGYVYSIDADSDGLDFKFRYKFKDKLYYHGIGALGIYRQNRLILLKISRRKPDLWIHVEKDIPECIISNLRVNLNNAWDSIPTCSDVRSHP